jgi:putative ABC transport system permease protein
MNDLKFAFRQLLKNPGFTAVAVLTLALGIGANTAMFSFVNAVLLRPLPYRDPDRLVMVFENHVTNGWFKAYVGAPLLAEWRKQNAVFEGLAAGGYVGFTLTGKGEPETFRGLQFSANMFSLLGIQPFLGRDFLPDEETYGKHHVVLVSYELWQRRFGGDTNLVGQTLTLNAESYTVIGVMPPRTFTPDSGRELWTPLAFSPDQLGQRHAHNYVVYGRLKPGVRLAQARAEMDVIARRMAVTDEQNRGWGAEVHLLQEIMVGDSRRVLLVLLGSVGFVLLIGCANIASLMLARSAARVHEFAVRAALGARRCFLIRQLLTESFLLASGGGLLGILFAEFGLNALIRFSPPDLPRMIEGVSLDNTTLMFTTMVTLATALLFGLLPALQVSNPALARELTETSRGSSASRSRQFVRATLVASEVALSLMLLVGAGLMIRSFGRLVSQKLGFVPEHIVTMGIGLPNQKYPEQGDRTRLYEQLLERTRALPGVQSAGAILGLPLSGNNSQLSVVVKDAPAQAPGEAVSAGYAQVSPGYFATMKIPLLQGRDFTDFDRTNTPPVLVVDETFVRSFKLGTSVLGRRIDVGDDTENAEIVGVVKDVKRVGLANNPRGEMYRTFRQRCWGYLTLVVRTQREPAELTRAIRAELDGLDKDLPLEQVRTMSQLVTASVAQRRLSVQLLSGFAAGALLLSALGLYGVLAYTVTQRTREIGIRMALGAQKQDVISLVIRHGMKLALTGVAGGVAGALMLTRVMQGLLFEIKPTDPVTFICVGVLLLGIALLASWLPARHATKVDPMEALRCE